MPKRKQHNGVEQKYLPPGKVGQPQVPKVPKLMAQPRLQKVRQSLVSNPLIELSYLDSQGVEHKLSHRIISEGGLPNGCAIARLISLAAIRLDKEIVAGIMKDAKQRGIENLSYMYPVRANGGRGDYALEFWCFGRRLYYRIFTARDYVLLLRSCLEEPPGRSLRQSWHRDTGLHFGECMGHRERDVLEYVLKLILVHSPTKPTLHLLRWWQEPYQLYRYIKTRWAEINPQLSNGPHKCPSNKTVSDWCHRWLLITQDRLVSTDQGFVGAFRKPRPDLAIKQDGVVQDLNNPDLYVPCNDLPPLPEALDRHPWASGIEEGSEVSALLKQLVSKYPGLRDGQIP
jgi:hypothetical protein